MRMALTNLGDWLMIGSGDDLSSFTVGQTLAGYELLGLLGEGGMGAVFLARHPRLPRNVALKVLHPALSRDPQYRARFEREAALAAGLDHPNIIAIHDRGLDDGRLWISMQYGGRTSAADVLADGQPVDPARAVHIVAKVAAALDYAHRVKLWHRDVKPANVMLFHDDPDEPERVLLTDFGIAKAGDAAVQLTQTGAFLATYAYAAPEQISSSMIDHRVDIYALGVVLFELLTGRQPFASTSPYALMVAHLQAEPPDPRALRPELPEGFWQVIAAAMAKNPDDRPASCRALAQAAAACVTTSRSPQLTHAPADPPLPIRQPEPKPQPAHPEASLTPANADPPAANRAPAAETVITGRTPVGATTILTPIARRYSSSGDLPQHHPEPGPPHQATPSLQIATAGQASPSLQFAQGSSIQVAQPPQSPSTFAKVRPQPRSRRRSLIAALLVLVIVAVTGVWLLTRQAHLDVPQSLTARPLSTGVTLTWSPVPGADNYEVHRGNEVIVTTPFRRYEDRGGDSGAPYEYRIRALSSDGAASALTGGVRTYAPLTAPVDLIAASVGTDVSLSWAPVPSATAYEIERDGVAIGSSDEPAFLDDSAPGGLIAYRVTGVSDNADVLAGAASTSLEHAAWGDLQPLATSFSGIVSGRPGEVSLYGATCTPGNGPAGTAYYDRYIVCTYPNGIRVDVLHYPNEAALAAARAQLLPTSRAETTWNYANSEAPEGPLLRATAASATAWRWIGYVNILDRVLSALYVEWPGHTDQELYDEWWLPTRIG